MVENLSKLKQNSSNKAERWWKIYQKKGNCNKEERWWKIYQTKENSCNKEERC